MKEHQPEHHNPLKGQSGTKLIAFRTKTNRADTLGPRDFEVFDCIILYYICKIYIEHEPGSS